jgi:hypothetical protein
MALQSSQIAAGGKTGANPMTSSYRGWIHKESF